MEPIHIICFFVIALILWCYLCAFAPVKEDFSNIRRHNYGRSHKSGRSYGYGYPRYRGYAGFTPRNVYRGVYNFNNIGDAVIPRHLLGTQCGVDGAVWRYYGMIHGRQIAICEVYDRLSGSSYNEYATII